MAATLHDQTLALAGIFQAARLTQSLAREGRADEHAFAASLKSLFTFDAAGVADVYGGVAGVALGLRLIEDKLTAAGEPLDFELARYAVSMIQLEAQLRRMPAMQDAIGDGLRTIEEQMKFFANGEPETSPHPRLAEKLGELYQQTLSTLSPRIMVNGENDHLSNPLTAAKVRAALFAGIRSAVLWHQKGGRRWQLLFFRRRIARTAGELRQLAAGH